MTITEKKTENKELVERHPIDGTPFTVCKDENGIYLLVGQSLIAEGYESVDAAIEDSKRTDWDRLMHIMCIIAEKVYQFNKSNE